MLKIFRVFYEYKTNPGNIYSVRVPVIGDDPEYSWRMSPMNVPHTNFISAKLEECT